MLTFLIWFAVLFILYIQSIFMDMDHFYIGNRDLFAGCF